MMEKKDRMHDGCPVRLADHHGYRARRMWRVRRDTGAAVDLTSLDDAGNLHRLTVSRSDVVPVREYDRRRYQRGGR
jgi:hypothetical protein